VSTAAGAEGLFANVLAQEPSRPFVTFYDDASGERIELSAKSLANWVAKTHFLIIDEVGLGVGDAALIALPADWIAVPILLGCWSAGLRLTDDPAAAAVAFVTPATIDQTAGVPEVFTTNPASMTRSFGAADAPAADYVTAVRPQPDAWASVKFVGSAADLATDGLTRAELVATATRRATELGLGPGARVLFDRPWTGAADWIDALLAPMAVVGSLVLVANPDPDPQRRARRIEQEQVSVAL
jgi:uncharacterized protein (TIGR03089 family)